MTDDKDTEPSDSLIESLVRLTGQVAGGTIELARNTATMTAMFGETWVRNAVLQSMEPERLEAMADAGRFLRDARETAGLSMKDMADTLGLSDDSMLEDVESGEKILPLELMLRSASLLARHDPIPFLIKFMRTYNPALGQTLEQWGVMTLPKNFERERRFVNLYRQHDVLRSFSDEEFARFNTYMDSSIQLVLDVMLKEREANSAKPKTAAKRKPRRASPKKTATSATAKAKAKTTAKRKTRTRSGSDH